MTTKPFAHLIDSAKNDWDENAHTVYQAAIEAFKAERMVERKTMTPEDADALTAWIEERSCS